MAAANRRFARRAKQQFVPFKSPQPAMQSSTQLDWQATNASCTKLDTANNVSITTAPESNNPSERPTPNTQYLPNTERRYYVLRRRVGKKTISTYVGAKDGAADMAFIDSIYRQAALQYRRIANELILKLKLLHVENERDFTATEAEMTTALTAAGYHRINRGPWRKMRLSPAVTAIPNTQYQVPSRAERLAIEREGIPELQVPNTERLTPSRSVPTPNAQRLTPVLQVRIKACRNHVHAIEELYQSTPIRARSKTAARTYVRYSKRALNRLAAAEQSLAAFQSILRREKPAQNDHL